MYTRLILTLGLLISTIESADITPKRFSIPARRLGGGGLRPRAENEADATNHIVVDFTFGGQQIPVALDSGSTFTYVASTLDTNMEDTFSLPTLYKPNISSTYHDENDPSDAFDCGGQSVVCFMGVDDVATAGLTAKGMAFGVATHLEGVFDSGQAATMGFGRQANDPSSWLPRDQTFWLRIGNSLEMPYLFTVNVYQDQDGTFDFGFIDTTKYTGEIAFVPMDTTRTNWNFKMNGFAIGNGSVQTVDEFVGVVDTGGPNMGLPSYIVNPYYDSFGGSPSPGNSHNYPCSAYPPPDLTLYLETGEKLVLNGTFLVDPPDGSQGTCNGRVDDSEQTAYNIGACVLDQKFVIYDHANARIGFADKRRDGQPEGVLPGNATTSSSLSTATSVPLSTTINPKKATATSVPSSTTISPEKTTATSAAPAGTTTAHSRGNRTLDIQSEVLFRYVYYLFFLYIMCYNL